MAALELAGHLSIEELGQRYRAARDRVERSHLQAVWLLRQGRVGGEVARVMGYSERWVAETVRRCNEEGPQGLADRRHGNAGAKPLLGEAQRAALAEALQGPPPEGGLWSGPEVAAWIAATAGQEVHPQRGWDCLIKLGFTLKRPCPRHAKADAAAQAAFRKGAARASGWAAGGPSRRGLRTLDGGWLKATLSTGSASSRCCAARGASAATFAQVLAAFAADAGAGPGKELLLVLDGAGWHVAKDVVLPGHLQLAFLPPYSPELQPAERLRPLANEAVADRCFDDLAALSEALEPHCLALARQPAPIRDRTLFGWWPRAKPAEGISRI